MTGRAAGCCAGYRVPGFANPVSGQGFGYRGRGRGGGFGRRNWYYATGAPGWARASAGYPAFGRVPACGVPRGAAFGQAPPAEQELDYLKTQAEYLEEALEDVRERIQELESRA